MDLTELATRLGMQLSALGARVTTPNPAPVRHCRGHHSGCGEFGVVRGRLRHLFQRAETRQLGVPVDLFETVGAVSREVVERMASGAQQASGARFAVAVSGIAGPGGGTPEKPVGTVWIAWADGERLFARRCLFDGDRQAVRGQTVETALLGLIRLVAGENPLQG